MSSKMEKSTFKKHKKSGKIIHKETNLIFDLKDGKTKFKKPVDGLVVGKWADDELQPLDSEMVEVCDKWGFEYDENMLAEEVEEEEVEEVEEVNEEEEEVEEEEVEEEKVEVENKTENVVEGKLLGYLEQVKQYLENRENKTENRENKKLEEENERLRGENKKLEEKLATLKKNFLSQF